MHVVHVPSYLVLVLESVRRGLWISLLLIKPQQHFFEYRCAKLPAELNWTASQLQTDSWVREDLGYSKQVVETQRRTLEE